MTTENPFVPIVLAVPFVFAVGACAIAYAAAWRLAQRRFAVSLSGRVAAATAAALAVLIVEILALRAADVLLFGEILNG